MQKWTYFNSRNRKGWPDPVELKHFFAPGGDQWFHTTGNDSADLSAEGLYGTAKEDHLAGRRVDLHLMMWGIPNVGVLLIYRKFGGGYREAYTSKSDMSRLREWVRSTHNDPLPVGLFIPFPKAYDAVKEFIETDGQLPKCIEWVANKDLPPGTFPDP